MIFNGSFFKGFLLGSLVGTALALFLAPSPGEETVSRLKTLTLEYKDQLEERLLYPQPHNANAPASRASTTTTIQPTNVAHNGHH